MHSEQLLGIPKHWHKLPRDHNRGINTRGARDAMDKWPFDNVSSRLNREMRLFPPNPESPPSDMSEDLLLGIKLKDDIQKMKEVMPTYWQLMNELSYTPRQYKRNKYKETESVSGYSLLRLLC
jgi:hypothetical protein